MKLRNLNLYEFRFSQRGIRYGVCVLSRNRVSARRKLERYLDRINFGYKDDILCTQRRFVR